MSRGSKAWAGGILAGLVGLIVYLAIPRSPDKAVHTGAPAAQDACGDRECLPDLKYVATNGVAYPRAALVGKIVLVNFWATWCHPCEREIPDLSRVYDKYKASGVVFLGVLTDTPDNQQLLNFQSDHEMMYPVVRASPELMSSFGSPDAFPTTLIYDRRGKQVYSHLGALHERDLESVISRLVAQK